jgi:hypothetical protein
MTQLVGTGDRAGPPCQAPSQPVPEDQRARSHRPSGRSPSGLALGTAATLITALSAHRNRVGPARPRRSGPSTACPTRSMIPPDSSCRWARSARPAPGAALLAHDRELAGRLLAGGTGTWLCPSWSNRPTSTPGGSAAARCRSPGHRPARPGRPGACSRSMDRAAVHEKSFTPACSPLTGW